MKNSAENFEPNKLDPETYQKLLTAFASIGETKLDDGRELDAKGETLRIKNPTGDIELYTLKNGALYRYIIDDTTKQAINEEDGLDLETLAPIFFNATTGSWLSEPDAIKLLSLLESA